MFDLYAFFDDFPGLAEVPPEASPEQRVTLLEGAMTADLADPRVIPYIQLHEFEALLFADCNRLCEFHGVSEKLEEVESIVSQAGGPEGVDDGPTTAPSRRIARLFPGHRKSVDGPAILKAAGLPLLRQRCPHFNGWIGRLEQAMR